MEMGEIGGMVKSREGEMVVGQKQRLSFPEPVWRHVILILFPYPSTNLLVHHQIRLREGAKWGEKGSAFLRLELGSRPAPMPT